MAPRPEDRWDSDTRVGPPTGRRPTTTPTRTSTAAAAWPWCTTASWRITWSSSGV
ncbi:hypothetical protein GBAR_LOCUS9028 [Geodia barretti]|uniref:Uncharacterized protein n=1 Tax=Geodia barretti TaxID=519541 RepID=A0AA35WBJ3_GEOBA|nr:hypothetical protein GBAR_LOCUS9028 [Geodia barretti]